MFVISHAGFLVGPFATAEEADAYTVTVTNLQGPWHIVKLREPIKILTDEARDELAEKWKKQYG